MSAKHPAKFTDSILWAIQDVVNTAGWPGRVLDPFAGTGRVHWICVNPNGSDAPFSVGVEIEPEWAGMEPCNIVGNALQLPFPDLSFDGLITSPCYGSRLADSHNAQDGSRRHSYTHDLGRKLHPDNSGSLHWGEKYREFHGEVWAECLRVLQPNSLIVLNVSNFFKTTKKGDLPTEQPVSEWHLRWFLDHGCQLADLRQVETPRLRHGVNRKRADHENVFALRTATSTRVTHGEINTNEARRFLECTDT